MFLTDSPCADCAIEIFEAGIRAVIFERAYRDTSGIHYLLKKGLKVYRVDADTGQIYEFFSCFDNPVKVVEAEENGIKI